MSKLPPLPPGFVLDEVPPLPPGFTLDDRRKPKVEVEPMNVDPTEGMGWGEKALVNLGAGFDTAWQGVKQIAGQGMSDEELKEKRRIDKHLADKTTGGGLIQVAGEVLPTIPLGMGAGALAGRAGGLAARFAASPTLAGVAGGASSGALGPVTSDESRLKNAALGAAGGAVAPHVLRLALATGRGAGALGDRALSALPAGWGGAEAAARSGRRQTAGILERELPGGVPRDVYTPDPNVNPSGIGVSAAARTQSPELAALERGSRTSGGEHWMDFDRAAHQQRWEALDQGLTGPAELRAAITYANDVGQQVPYQAIDQRVFTREMDDFIQNLQHAKSTAQYHGNPTVRAAVDYVEDTMRQAGTVTPELLHTMRRTAAKGLTGAPGAGEAGVRAASSEPFVIGLTKSMDDVLDRSSGGAWNRWKADYSDAMRQAEGIKADMNIRGKFVDQATGTLRKTSAGGDDVPVVTGAALKQAIAQAGSMKRGVRKGQNILLPQSQRRMESVLADIEQSGIVQRSKAASTGGGGSDTASNLAQSLALEAMMPGYGVARYATGQVLGHGDRKAQREMQQQLARLLQDPEALRRFMLAQERQRLLREGFVGDTAGGLGAAIGGGAAAVPALLSQ